MNKILMFSSICILGLSTQAAWADGFCESNSTGATLGPVSSLNVASLPQQQISGGLRCGGFGLSFISLSTMRYQALTVPNVLKSTDGSEARITIFDFDNQAITSGYDRTYHTQSPIFIFGGANETVPFYIRVNETTGLKPGIYKGSFNIQWYYAIPLASPLFVIYYTNNGMKISPTLIGSQAKITNWGTPIVSTIPITLTVEKDCKINAQNINFGTAPLVSKFNPVTGSIKITCSAQTPYTVGVNNGQNYSQTRRMKNQSSNQYLPYEIYKNTSTNRWGSIDTERWSSANASQNPNIYDGSVSQGYSYTAKIIDNGSNASIAGTYKDNLILEVAF